MRVHLATFIVAAVTIASGARSLGAQRQSPQPSTLPFSFGVPRADSLLSRGSVAQAESLYYRASNARPSDPLARAALGRYVAARGAFRVGIVLLEEARTFGGDAAVLARDLVPLYDRLNDHAALARLPRSPLGEAEHARAVWLAANPFAAVIPSGAAIPYVPGGEPIALGRVRVRIGGIESEAVIDPAGDRIVIDPGDSVAVALRTFPVTVPVPGRGLPAVIDSLEIGVARMTNVAVTVAPLPAGTRIVIGATVLARYAPTFDPTRRTITLRASGTAPTDSLGLRLPLVFGARGPMVLLDGRWVALGSQELRTIRGARRMTIDLRRGVVSIAR